MYPPELEDLMTYAIANGELTAKKKIILFKKAESLGIDLDEFEMVLDGRLFEKRQTMNPTPMETPSITLPQAKDDSVDNISLIRALFIEYFKIEENISVEESQESTFGKIAKGVIGNSGIWGSIAVNVVDAFNDDDDDMDYEERRAIAIRTRKEELITRFPIPMSKEEFFEFLSKAVSLARPAKKMKSSLFIKMFDVSDSDEETLATAQLWMNKCELVISKAKFSLKNDPKALSEIMFYASELGIR
jgi:hypothetical protein